MGITTNGIYYYPQKVPLLLKYLVARSIFLHFCLKCKEPYF